MTDQTQTTTEPVLLPCPFCGGEAASMRNGSWQTSCTECHAGTPMSYAERELSEAAWNRRAATPDLLEALKVAIAALEMADQTVDARGAQLIARAALLRASAAEGSWS